MIQMKLFIHKKDQLQHLNVHKKRQIKQTTDKKINVFNHRPNAYKNYPWFLKQMDKLWKKEKTLKYGCH